MAGRRAGSRAKGRAVPFIGKGGGGGRAGGNFAGEDGAGGGAQLGEDADSVRGSAMATAWRAGARGEVGSCQGRPVSSKLGARGWVWAEARRVGGQVAAPAYGRRRGRGAGRREVEEPVSGGSVIFSKFKNPVM